MLQTLSSLVVRHASIQPDQSFEVMLALGLPFDQLCLAPLELATECIPALCTTHNTGIKEHGECARVKRGHHPFIVTSKDNEAKGF